MQESKLEFKEWLGELKAVFLRLCSEGWTDESVHNYVFDNAADWRGMYDDDYSPTDAAHEDMTYWTD